MEGSEEVNITRTVGSACRNRLITVCDNAFIVTWALPSLQEVSRKRFTLIAGAIRPEVCEFGRIQVACIHGHIFTWSDGDTF